MELLALWDSLPWIPPVSLAANPQGMFFGQNWTSVAGFTPAYQTSGANSTGSGSTTVTLSVTAGQFAIVSIASSSVPTNTLGVTDTNGDSHTAVPGGSYLDSGATKFNATPTNGGSGFVSGDAGKLLTLTCGATVAISTVSGGAVTAIATTPTAGGSGCTTGTGKTTTCSGCNGGGGNNTATVNLTYIGPIVEMFYMPMGTTNASEIFTCTASNSSGYFACIVALYNGTPASGWDVTGAGANNLATTAWSTGTTGTTSNASELGTAVFGCSIGLACVGTFSSSGSWTIEKVYQFSTEIVIGYADKVLASTGAQTATATFSTSSYSGAGLVSTIK